MSKKCTPLWREAHFEVKNAKNWRVRSIFGRSDVVSRGMGRGLWILSKVSKTWESCSISKNDGRHGTFDEDLRKMHFPSEMLGGQGADFLRRVAFWSIRSSVLGRWFCVTGAQNALVRGRELCTQLSIFEGSLAELFRFRCCQLLRLRKSRRIVSFVMLSSSKFEEVSRNWFFDVVKFKNWGRLAK